MASGSGVEESESPVGWRGDNWIDKVIVLVLCLVLAGGGMSIAIQLRQAQRTEAQGRQNGVQLAVIRAVLCPEVRGVDPGGVKCKAAIVQMQATQGEVIARIADAERQRQILHDVCRVAREHGISARELQGC